MVSPILRTKLCLPPARPNLIVRPRLLRQLDASLDHPLTLISAPAGFGKSTLVSQWVHLSQEQPDPIDRTAWLSLEQDDDSPGRFWEYLLAALEMVLRESVQFETAHLLLQGQPDPPTQLILTDVINQISSLNSELLLVLDDFQTIHSPDLLEGIAFLVEHLPASMHMILLTRSDPSVPLGRWRARGWLNEIRTADLRFTLDEAAAYFDQMQTLSLSAPEIQALSERTEGWIAGLQMAGLSLRDRNPAAAKQFILEFTGQDHLILDYLTDEVLLHQPDFIQEFLLKTSILSQLCTELCEAIVNPQPIAGSDAHPVGSYVPILEQLEHANLFVIPLDRTRTWYRYHRLFEDLLRVRLKERHPDWIPELHRQAALWYESNGYPFEAMQHALAAEDLTLATDVIERIVRKPSTWSTGNIARLLETVNALPPTAIAARPWLRVYLSGILYVGGQPITADQMLAAVEESLPDLLLLEGGTRQELALYANTFRAFYAATLGNTTQAIERAQQTLSRVTEDDRRVYGHALATLAQAAFTQGDVNQAGQLYQKAVDNQKRKNARFTAMTWSSNLADVLTLQGRLHQAMDVCQEAITYGSQEGSPGSAIGYTQTFQAAILYEWNRLAEAEEVLLNGLRLLQVDGISPNFGRAHATLAMIQQAQGKSTDAANSIAIALQIAQRSQSKRYIERVAAYQARLWLMQAESRRAHQWAERVRADPVPLYLHEFEDLTLALVFLEEQRLSEAEAILAPILNSAEQAGRQGILIEALAIQALIFQQQPGKKTSAQQTLLQALQYSESEHYLRTYRNLGQPMADLLRSLTPLDRSQQAYRDLLLDLFPLDKTILSLKTPAQQSELVENLSERELEILSMIAAGMSNGQISQKLYLSLNTVRAHTSHIFGKLGVHNRTEAVARGREIGLLN